MRSLYFLLATILLLPLALFAQNLDGIDEIGSFNEGLAPVRKGNQWGFINEEGTLVIDFRTDVYWNKNADPSKSDVSGIRYPTFKEGRCLITKKIEDGIPVFGFIDTKGNVILEPSLLNVYPFENGYTTGILFEKVFRGNNEFKLKIYDFKFFDVLLNSSGEIVEYYDRRHNIHLTKRRYKLPVIGAKKLAGELVAVYRKDKGWEINKLSTTN